MENPMTKILMRGNCSPLSNPTISELIRDNTIGSNSGNMIFQASVMRALMKKDTQIDFINTRNEGFRDHEIDRLKNQYDYFVIPLANAFRSGFLTELTNLRRMVERLDLPCIVIGVGCQANLSGKFSTKPEVDEQAKLFVSSVLEHSATIGIRGEYTAKYLKNLGFSEGRHFEIIGCPSMFMFGEDLPSPRPHDLTPRSRINFNRKLALPAAAHHLIERLLQPFEDYWFVPQNYDDFKLLYAGKPLGKLNADKDAGTYPLTKDDPICRAGRIRGFLNVPSWIDFMKKGDFTFGTRIHGNIISVLSGVPTYIFAPDMRVLELAEYHNIPHRTIQEAYDVRDLFGLYDETDFSSVIRGHRERFAHYVDFLNKNGLPHIWDGSEQYKDSQTPYDIAVRRTRFHAPMRPYITHNRLKRKLINRAYGQAQKERKEIIQARKKMDADL